MVELNTRAFGEIAIEDDKVINFEHGILGFPDLKRFTLIFNIEKGVGSTIKWLQSLDEPDFALPVMEPNIIVEDYEPEFAMELLEPLGNDLDSEDLLILVTVTVPRDVTKTTINLRAPIIVNALERKAVQLISDNTSYAIKCPVFDILEERKRKAGE